MKDMSDKELIFRSLNMWANYIETGDVILNGKEARERYERNKNDRFKRQGIEPPRTLDEDQMRMVLRLRDLAVDHLNGKAMPEEKLGELASSLPRAPAGKRPTF